MSRGITRSAKRRIEPWTCSGVKLCWAGYDVRYVPLCLAKGVAPADFASLANQQNRWCRSSMMLMVDKHFREARYSWQQRVAYWAAFLYYMSSAALLFTGPFPTLTMMWFFPRQVHAYNYLVILPSFAATLFAFPMLTSGWRPTTRGLSSRRPPRSVTAKRG